jgi:outer membrane translocation and assembly module TamA
LLKRVKANETMHRQDMQQRSQKLVCIVLHDFVVQHNANRHIVGGRYLVTMSGEYTHWIKPTWGAAVFVDAGNAVDDWQAMDLAVGYGVGARWRSPAGPLGIDLAYGQREGKLRLDFSLAIPF